MDVILALLAFIGKRRHPLPACGRTHRRGRQWNWRHYRTSHSIL